jgi:hypothetical protein
VLVPYFCHQRWHWSVESQLNITGVVPTNINITAPPVWQDVLGNDTFLTNAAPWRVVRLLSSSLSVAKLSLSYINDVTIAIFSSFSETVVDIFVKIVDCRVFILNRASHCGFNGGALKIWSFLTATTQFLALQMVKLSSLHDEGRPADVFYHHRRDTLVIALRMVVSWSILDFTRSF